MSSFGGIPMDIDDLYRHMISSANNVFSGVPGFGFVIAKQSELEKCKGQARLIALICLTSGTAWKATMANGVSPSPTHTVRFLPSALELSKKAASKLVIIATKPTKPHWFQACALLVLEPLLNDDLHSPIITSSILQLIAITNSKNSHDRLERTRVCNLSGQGFKRQTASASVTSVKPTLPTLKS